MNWRSGNSTVIILSSFAVAATLIIGYFYFKNGESKKTEIPIPKSQNNISPTPLKTSEEKVTPTVAPKSARAVCNIPEELETTNTKVYIDRRNCFTFRYPADWNFEPIDPNSDSEYWIEFKNGYNVWIRETLGQSTKEFTENFFSNIEGGYSELSYITLNGYNVAKFYIRKSSVDPTPHGTVNYFFDNNTTGVNMEAMVSGDIKKSMDNKQLEEIASSFRFW